MSTLLIQSGTLDDIADAIRAKTGKVASMTPLEMPDEIESISGGGGEASTLVITTDTSGSYASVLVADNTFTISNSYRYSQVSGEANAVVTEVCKVYYDTSQSQWKIKATTDVTCDGTDYSAGDVVASWAYNVSIKKIVVKA